MITYRIFSLIELNIKDGATRTVLNIKTDFQKRILL